MKILSNEIMNIYIYIIILKESSILNFGKIILIYIHSHNISWKVESYKLIVWWTPIKKKKKKVWWTEFKILHNVSY